MSYCSDRDYVVGDLFEVINVSKGMEEYLTKGMILKLTFDDKTSHRFSYVSGDLASCTESVQDCLWVDLNDVKKVSTVKVEPQQQQTYTKQDIEAAFNDLNWEESFEGFMIALNVVSNPEYKEYLRLKDKYEKTIV